MQVFCKGNPDHARIEQEHAELCERYVQQTHNFFLIDLQYCIYQFKNLHSDSQTSGKGPIFCHYIHEKNFGGGLSWGLISATLNPCLLHLNPLVTAM